MVQPNELQRLRVPRAGLGLAVQRAAGVTDTQAMRSEGDPDSINVR